MTAEKYTFPVNDGGFDAVFREYRAIFFFMKDRVFLMFYAISNNQREK